MGRARALPRGAPTAQGVAAGGVWAFLDAVAARGLELHSLMLLRHGQVVAEGWWRPYAAGLPHMLYSLSKSFTSTAVGLAVDEGRLSVDDPVVSFFPGDLPGSVGANLAAMRVRHLLTMGTGHDQDTTGRMRQAGDWVRGFLGLDVEHAPGSKFVYNSGATYMLSAIVQRVTGATLLEYLGPRLFEPLGIEGATWESSPQGIHAGGWGLSVTTEAIARFGQLYLQGGLWEGRRVVPAAWVAAATTAQIRNGDGGRSDWAQGYGYQFWRCRHGAYRGDGAHGQFCVVMPEQDAVVAITSGVGDLQGVLDCVWEHLLPALAGGGDGGADARLRARLEGLSLGPAVGGAGNGQAAAPAVGGAGGRRLASGRAWVLEPNAAHLEGLRLDFGGGSCRASLVQAGKERTIACGFGAWHGGDDGGTEACAGHAAWEADGSLRLDWYRVRTPFGGTLRVSPDGEGVVMEYRTNLGEQARGLTIRGR